MKFLTDLRLLPVLFAFNISICGFAANKEYVLDVEIKDATSGKFLEGIAVTFSSPELEKETVYTNSQGKARFTRSTKLSYAIIECMDTSGQHVSSTRILSKSELKQTTLIQYFSLSPRKNYELLLQEFYKRDAKVREANIASGQDTTIYDLVSDDCNPGIDAEFRGGQVEMQRYISGIISYPQEAIEMNEQGRVYVRFVIEKDGTISHAQVVRGVSPALDYEALRVIYKMPKWNPAKCDGEAIRNLARMPIMFTLE